MDSVLSVLPSELQIGDYVMQPSRVEREVVYIIPRLNTHDPGYLVMYKGVGESRFLPAGTPIDMRRPEPTKTPEWE